MPVDPGNRLVGSIMNLIDAEEVERTKARTRASHEQLAKEGRPSGTQAYGYRRVTKNGRPMYEVDPVEAAVVRRMCDELIAGHSASAICQRLNDDGIATPRPSVQARGADGRPVLGDDGKPVRVPRPGTHWRPASLRSVVTKASIAGLRTHHGEVTGPAMWAAIVDEETWRKATRALHSATVVDSRGRRVHAPGAYRARRKWLLTGGLARCGFCGTGHQAETGRPRLLLPRPAHELPEGLAPAGQAGRGPGDGAAARPAGRPEDGEAPDGEPRP